MSKHDRLRAAITESALLHAERKRANMRKARAAQHTRGKALKQSRDEIAAYLARVPEPV